MKKIVFLFVLFTACDDLGQSNNWDYFIDGGVNNSDSDTFDIDSDISDSDTLDSNTLDTDSGSGDIALHDTDWIDELSKKCLNIKCTDPPSDTCFDQHRLKTYRGDEGFCIAGKCIYTWFLEPCDICYTDEFGVVCEMI